MTTLLTTIKHVSSDSLRNAEGTSTAGGVNKLGATLPMPGTALAATYNFKVDDKAIPSKTMPERARRARKEVKKRFQHGPLHIRDRDWANSTYVDGSKHNRSFFQSADNSASFQYCGRPPGGQHSHQLRWNPGIVFSRLCCTPSGTTPARSTATRLRSR